MNERITLELRRDDLERICWDLASELQSDMPAPLHADDDFAGILQQWQNHSRRYVAATMARRRQAAALGFGRAPKLSDIRADKELHDATAAMLARFLPYLEEVKRP